MKPRFVLSGEIGFDLSFAQLDAFLTGNPGPVDVLINSPGGRATDGAAMMAAVEHHGKVTVTIQGLAASAASLVAVGGQIVQMHPDALMMIHEPALATFGTADQLRADADIVEKMRLTYAKAYARATGNPVSRVAAWMAVETWMTAAEAVELGFADRIVKTDDPAEVAAFDYSRFRHAPAALVMTAREKGWTAKPKP